MGEVVGYRNYYLIITLFSGTRTVNAGRLTPTYYISIDAVCPRLSLLVALLQKSLLGELYPKTPSFEAGIWISSLNVESTNFRTALSILVIRSSNDASPQKESGYEGKTAEFCFFGSLLQKKSFSKEFPDQNTPFSNFSTTTLSCKQ
jgi:hypothetical protein